MLGNQKKGHNFIGIVLVYFSRPGDHAIMEKRKYEIHIMPLLWFPVYSQLSGKRHHGDRAISEALVSREIA
jgi:hypothetical protein